MADKKAKVAAVPKGPGMQKIICSSKGGAITWGNQTKKGTYRCCLCSSEAHEKAKE